MSIIIITMTGYTESYNELKTIFNAEADEINITGSNISIRNVSFQSDAYNYNFSNTEDKYISENTSFSYPVFTPEDKNSKKVILLLHGLNERSWTKYLSWAFYLASETGSYVILFPISFHINRSPEIWGNPREMMPFMKSRNSVFSDINMSSFANVALSNRLTEDPMRFFNSGYQTISDINKLLLSIRNGEHTIIPAESSVNIFAYSIGAFLAQIMVMGNPENLFANTKLFIFCGGSVFSNMNGTSKLIMDSLAYNKVYGYYMDDFEKSIKTRNLLFEFFRNSQVGMAFRSMIDIGRFKTFREDILKKLKGHVHTISLSRDKVIPPDGIIATQSAWSGEMKNVAEVWDFPFGYSHENPFPVYNSALSLDVDRCFNKVFSAAAAFLA